MIGRSYRDLTVWQKAMDLVVDCYTVAQSFPKFETYGLADQMRRAAVSVPANIAEGQRRQYIAEFIHFLYISSGSLAELETHIQIAQRLGYLNDNKMNGLLDCCDEVGKMLTALIKVLKAKKGIS